MLNNDSKFSVMFNHYLWLIPFCISILFFSLKGIHILPDSSWYLSNGLNIYKGLGYVNPDLTPVLNRGPVFPALIAGSFYLFGVKVESAFWIVRTFYIFNVLLIYFLGVKLYGKRVGLTASLLVLTSHIINIWSSYILVDNILPFFILLYILFLYCAFEKQSYSYYFLSGSVIGIAFLTKEMAVLYLPLPFIICITVEDYRKRSSFIGLAIIFIAFLMIVGPWVYHINQYKEAADLILGADGSGALNSLFNNDQDRETLAIIDVAIRAMTLVNSSTFILVRILTNLTWDCLKRHYRRRDDFLFPMMSHIKSIQEFLFYQRIQYFFLFLGSLFEMTFYSEVSGIYTHYQIRIFHS